MKRFLSVFFGRLPLLRGPFPSLGEAAVSVGRQFQMLMLVRWSGDDGLVGFGGGMRAGGSSG